LLVQLAPRFGKALIKAAPFTRLGGCLWACRFGASARRDLEQNAHPRFVEPLTGMHVSTSLLTGCGKELPPVGLKIRIQQEDCKANANNKNQQRILVGN
jgi:hypothetical protein